jgi:hypothetical protein
VSRTGDSRLLDRESWMGATLLLCVLAVCLGCIPYPHRVSYSHQLDVTNQTDRAWFIRQADDGTGAGPFVDRIAPNSRGYALAWVGDAVPAVQILDLDCNVIATASVAGDQITFIDADGFERAAGLAARIVRFETRPRAEIYPVQDACGGLVYL